MNEDDNKSSNLNRKQKILFVLLWLLTYSTVLLLSSVGVLFVADEPENTTLVDTTLYFVSYSEYCPCTFTLDLRKLSGGILNLPVRSSQFGGSAKPVFSVGCTQLAFI